MVAVEPLFMISPVSGEVAGIAGTAMAGAIAALWRRNNVLQDRCEQEATADKATLVDLVERVITSLDENTTAIREANRA